MTMVKARPPYFCFPVGFLGEKLIFFYETNTFMVKGDYLIAKDHKWDFDLAASLV